MTDGRRIIALVLFALALCTNSIRAQDQKDAAAKQAQVQKARQRLEKSLARVAPALAKVTGTSRVAWLTLRPEEQSPELAEQAALIQDVIIQYLLREGILVFPFEAKHPVTVEYKNGKLPSGMLVRDSDLEFLRGIGISLLMIPRYSVKSAGPTVSLDLCDFSKRAKKSYSGDVTIGALGDIALSEVCGSRFLPLMNVHVLALAIASMRETVGAGECWDVPAAAIRSKGGRVEGYDFGEEVAWQAALPGDVITFGDADGSGHVVVLAIKGTDKSTSWVLHQNWGGNRTVALESLAVVEAGKAPKKSRIWRP